LWNAGALQRWSNADGLIRELYTDADHNSYKTVDSISGTDYLDQLDGDVASFCNNATENCPPDGDIPDWIGTTWGSEPTGDGHKAPYGSLVAKSDGEYETLGTNASVSVPSSHDLALFYWDTTTSDNAGSVKVTVATDSIQCTFNDESIAAQGEIRGSTPVQLIPYPTLNVSNDSTTAKIPVTIVGCADYSPSFDILRDGSPIISDDTMVYVANKGVTLENYKVGNTISQPSCDDGQKLMDLKLSLNRKDVIDALAPDGQCTNGVNSFKLEIGSDTNGWYAGTGTITLTNCQESASPGV
jgi:hypothetical protein